MPLATSTLPFQEFSKQTLYPASLVTGQLLTVPFELLCYITLAIVTIFGVRERRILAPVATIAVVLLYFSKTVYYQGGHLNAINGPIRGGIQVATFLSGVSVYFYRNKLLWN